jgi:hypothetical protein
MQGRSCLEIRVMILNAIVEKLRRQSKDDFKGRQFEAWLIMQEVVWYLRYPLGTVTLTGRRLACAIFRHDPSRS